MVGNDLSGSGYVPMGHERMEGARESWEKGLAVRKGEMR
jgi:hypothetical protein